MDVTKVDHMGRKNLVAAVAVLLGITMIASISTVASGKATATSLGAILEINAPDPIMAGSWPSPLSLVQQAAYQVVFDVEDPSFEFLGGNWILSKSGSYTGSFYYTLSGPGDGSGGGRWIVEGLPPGDYTIEFFSDSGDYASDARYQVIHADGVTNLEVDMNGISAGWHSLGEYRCNGVCVVNLSDFWAGSGTMLSADALRFTLTTPLPDPPVSGVTPHIGICIDDAGSVDPHNAANPIYTLVRLPYPVTVAVMPLRSYTNSTAEAVYDWGKEVILHQPMAAISVPDPGIGGLTDSMTLEQVRSFVSTNLDAIPHVVGMNNHMGSLITQQSDKMTVCMEELLVRDLYFYDSRTITTSVGFDVAMDQGVLTAERDLFIDDNTVEGVKNRVRNLALRARFAPEVPHLAIGHVRTATATALGQIAPELEAMGVEVWPISRCVSQVIETDRQPNGTTVETTGDWIQNPENAYSKMLYNGYSYSIADPATTRSDESLFRPNLQRDGEYDVFTVWPLDVTNSPDIEVDLSTFLGKQILPVDQSVGPNGWRFLGRYGFFGGSAASIRFHDTNATTPDRVFRVDAVRFDYSGPLPDSSFVAGWILY